MKNLKLLAVTFGLVGCLASCGEKDPVLTNVEIDKSEATTIYTVNEAFSYEGLKVIATYDDGSKQEVEFTIPHTPDMSTTGEKEVVVNFELDGAEQVMSYKINVCYWTSEDLQVFADSGLLFNELNEDSASDPFVFPYLPGMKTVSTRDDEGKLVDWYITLENTTQEVVDDYIDSLTSISEELVLREDDPDTEDEDESYIVYYELTTLGTLPTGACEYAGVVNKVRDNGTNTVSVLQLAPYTVNSQQLQWRYDDEDEFFVVGLDANNNMIIKDRMVSAVGMNDIFGCPIGYENVRLGHGMMDEIADYFNNDRSGIAKSYSQCSSGVIVLPETPVMSTDTSDDSYFTTGIQDFKILNPFSKKLDKYDFAVGIGFYYSEDEHRNEMVANLRAAGFSEEEETVVEYTDGSTVTYSNFVFDDFYAGQFEVAVSEFQENMMDDVSGFDIEVLFTAPEVSMTKGQRAIYESFYKNLGFALDEVRFADDESLVVKTNASFGTDSDPLKVLKTAMAMNSGNFEEIKLEPVWYDFNKDQAVAVYTTGDFKVTAYCFAQKDDETGLYYPAFDVIAKRYNKVPVTVDDITAQLASALGVTFDETIQDSGIFHASYDRFENLGMMYAGLQQDMTYVGENYLATVVPSYFEDYKIPFRFPTISGNFQENYVTYSFMDPETNIFIEFDLSENLVSYTFDSYGDLIGIVTGICVDIYVYQDENYDALPAEYDEISIAQEISKNFLGTTQVQDLREQYGAVYTYFTYIDFYNVVELPEVEGEVNDYIRDLFKRAATNLPAYAKQASNIMYYQGEYQLYYVCGEFNEYLIIIDIFFEDLTEMGLPGAVIPEVGYIITTND